VDTAERPGGVVERRPSLVDSRVAWDVAGRFVTVSDNLNRGGERGWPSATSPGRGCSTATVGVAWLAAERRWRRATLASCGHAQ
jgi:hypothetical protein